MSQKRTDLWSIDEFLSATRGRPVGEMPDAVDGISIDTRTLQPGDAFFAIKGGQFDGHDFVSKAASKQAALAVVGEEKLVALGGLRIPLVIVNDVLGAMEQLAVAARWRSKARIIAITGSVGKTTTKEMLRTLLEPCGKVHASVASYNNHWGVPLSLSRMARDVKYGIFEIGMNHPGEITPLVKMVRPHVAVITTVAEAHLGFFKNLEEIARAKGEIFNGIVRGGNALINRDIKQFSLLSKMAKDKGIENIFGFGEKRGAKFVLKEVLPSASGSHLSLRLNGKKIELEFGLPGIHMVANLLAALGAASLAGADIGKVSNAVSKIAAVKGRGESVVYGQGRRAITLIDESYNANPASMEASLKVLAMHVPTGKGRRVAVLGDMLELGESSHKLHKELEIPIREAKIDRIWLVGAEILVLAEDLKAPQLAGHFKDAAAVEKALLKDLTPGDVIMFKASLGIKFGPLVEAVKKHLASQ